MRLVIDEKEEGGDDAMVVLIQENLFENCFTIPSATEYDITKPPITTTAVMIMSLLIFCYTF
jgi:hypothetical protein